MKTQLVKPLSTACLLVLAAASPHAGEEQDLMATLQSAASVPEKCAACQKLRRVGTAKSVPVLAGLLGEERTGHAALHALEAMPCPEAGAALRAALGQSGGALKAGLIAALGWRRDAEAVSLLAPFLVEADATIAAAAACALGRIGGEDAVAVLHAVPEGVAPEVRLAAAEGLLRCAERLLAGGDAAAAETIYGKLHEAQMPEPVRTAAFRGLALSNSRQRPELVRNALLGEDRAALRGALRVLRELDDAAMLDACAEGLSSLPAAGQIAVAEAMAGRGAAALPALALAARSPHPCVRVAAFQALAEANDSAAVPLLAAGAALGDEAGRQAALDALGRLHGPGLREALLAHLRNAEPEGKMGVLRALGERREAAAAPAVLEVASQETGPLRVEAFRALAKLGSADTLASILSLASGATEESERAAAFETVMAICAASRDKEKCAEPLLAAMDGGDAGLRRSLLPVLSRLGTGGALAAACAAAGDADDGLAMEAIRVLSQWPDVDAAPHLLELARSQAGTARQILALRGFVGLARLEPDEGKRLAMLSEAMRVAQRPEEKKQALGEIGRMASAEALQTAQAFLEDPVLAAEAAAAVTGIRQRMNPANPPKP